MQTSDWGVREAGKGRMWWWSHMYIRQMMRFKYMGFIVWKLHTNRGAGVAQSVKRLSVQFLVLAPVMISGSWLGSSPISGSALSRESAWDSLSPPLPLPGLFFLSLSSKFPKKRKLYTNKAVKNQEAKTNKQTNNKNSEVAENSDKASFLKAARERDSHFESLVVSF